VCCATGTGTGLTPTYRCQTAGHTCNGAAGPGTPIGCASAADCPGSVCCGVNNNGFYEQVSCQPTCAGTSPDGSTLVTFCATANDCPPNVGLGQCLPSKILTGFNVCN
jgi:hypothetical protein